MKKFQNVLFVIMTASLLLAACGGQPRMIQPPTSYDTKTNGGHTVDFVVSEVSVPDRYTGTITYAPLGENTGIEIVVFQPDFANEVLMLAPIGGSIALKDGVQFGPADVIAAVYSSGKLVAIVVSVGITAYATYQIFEGLEDLVVTVETVYIPRSPQHKQEHDVINNLAQATAILTGLHTIATTNPPPGNDQTRCIEMQVSGAVARYIVWQYSHTNPVSGVARGAIIIWHAAAPAGVDPWVGTYANKSADTLLKVPSDLSDPNISMVEVGCGNFPPPPALPG